MSLHTCLLSACIIAGADAAHLPSRVRSLKKIAGQVMIADAGADRAELAEAEQAGAQVYHPPWDDSFSSVKNFCLRHASGKWILFLHENESISESDYQKLSRLLISPNAEAYLIYSSCHEQGISSPVQSLRLLKNRKEYRFSFRSFEMIPSDTLANILDSHLSIRHPDKQEGNWEHRCRSSLLRADLEEHADSCYVQYLCGIQALNEGKPEESIPYLTRSMETVNPEYLFAPHLYKCLAWCFLYLKHPQEALSVLQEGIHYFPAYSDLLVLGAELHRQLGHFQEAERDLKTCIETLQRPSLSVPTPEIRLADVFEMAGDLYRQTHNDLTALQCYQQAFKLNPENTDCLTEISRLSCRSDAADALESLLTDSLEEQKKSSVSAVTETLFRLREFRKILSYTDQIKVALPNNRRIHFMESFCRMMQGRTLCADGSDKAEELLLKIQDCWFHGRWIAAEKLLKELDQTDKAAKAEKNFYHLAHDLLTGKKGPPVNLNASEYDRLELLHGNLLFLSKERPAKRLLPTLAAEHNRNRLLRLAQEWAQKGHYKTVKALWREAAGEKGKEEVRTLAAMTMLWNQHPYAAQSTLHLGNARADESFTAIIRAECLINRARKKIAELPGSIKAAEIPPPGLHAFAQAVCSTEKPGESGGSGVSSARLHQKIGDHYLREGKKREAFCAYLHALQWSPTCFSCQQKVGNLVKQDRSLLPGYRKSNWVLEGNLFHQKDRFLTFLYGMFFFNRGEYERAWQFFLHPGSDAEHPVLLAYRTVIAWLMPRRFSKKASPPTGEAVSFLLSICKIDALNQLIPHRSSFFYHDLLELEIQKLQNRT